MGKEKNKWIFLGHVIELDVPNGGDQLPLQSDIWFWSYRRSKVSFSHNVCNFFKFVGVPLADLMPNHIFVTIFGYQWQLLVRMNFDLTPCDLRARSHWRSKST